MSSDDAVGVRRIGPFFRAIDLKKKPGVLIDSQKVKCWPGAWVGLQYQPVLLRFEGRWYVGRYSYALSGYETPPGCRQGITFVEIDVTAALIFCDENGLNDPYPPELIEDFESSKTSVGASQEDRAAGASEVRKESSSAPVTEAIDLSTGVDRSGEKLASGSTTQLAEGEQPTADETPDR